MHAVQSTSIHEVQGELRTRIFVPRVSITIFIGAWLSLVERTVRDREVGGSNPLAPMFLCSERLP